MENGKQSAFGYGFANEQAHQESQGLTKREYFAAMAMQGLLSNHCQIDTTNFEWVAEHAIGYADETLKQLEKITLKIAK